MYANLLFRQWRWSSEYNLYCCPEDYIKKGLNFEQFANLSHCNRTKVQAFYYSNNDDKGIPLITTGKNSGKVLHSKIEFNHEGVCLNKHGLLLKQGTYTTFPQQSGCLKQEDWPLHDYELQQKSPRTNRRRTFQSNSRHTS